jgi:glycerol-3-phosphate dehydrogenase
MPWQLFCEAFREESGLPRQSAEHLLRVYGTQAPDVLATATTPELRAVFDPASGAIAAEVPWAYEREGARTLGDVIARRTMTGLGPDAGIGADLAAARVARQEVDWDEQRARQEVDAYRRWVSRYRPRALACAATTP